jgi:hypothetical protein
MASSCSGFVAGGLSVVDFAGAPFGYGSPVTGLTVSVFPADAGLFEPSKLQAAKKPATITKTKQKIFVIGLIFKRNICVWNFKKGYNRVAICANMSTAI